MMNEKKYKNSNLALISAFVKYAQENPRFDYSGSNSIMILCLGFQFFNILLEDLDLCVSILDREILGNYLQFDFDYL